MRGRPEDWFRVVSTHAHSTLALIASSHHPSCLKIAADEVKHINRWMQQVVFDDLPKRLPESWFLAAIVCPGDDMTHLGHWMTKHGSDRVRFYLHTKANATQLGPIRDAGHELRHVRPERYASYGPMHKRLGLDLSDQIYEDFRPKS